MPLVASVLLRDPEARRPELELKAAVHELMRDVEAAGAHVYVPRTDRDYALAVGLRMLTCAAVLEETEDSSSPTPPSCMCCATTRTRSLTSSTGPDER